MEKNKLSTAGAAITDAVKLEYNIVTISGSSLLNHYSVRTKDGNAYISFEIDFSDPRERRRYIKVTDAYKDTAMFYQIRKVLEKDRSMEWTEDSLKQSIIFIDFESLFSNLSESGAKEITNNYSSDDLSPKSKKITDEYRLKSLFENGINIKYSDSLMIHYIPFDKSNSMSRQSKMSFINEVLVEELNHRLNLDITFGGQEVNLSKYYAYRGLFLSTAERVVEKEKMFDSNRVVIIKDASTNAKNQLRITAKKDKDETRKWTLCDAETVDIPIKAVFDGEGIISPEYSRFINQACGYKNATSFQIRMPFIKGMLHEVDFHAFIKEFVGEVDSFYITDAFGVKRDLLKAEIVMPVSMLKCKKWLEKEFCNTDKSVCMDFYFEKFYEYDHALYISNTNLIYGKSVLTKLNYQFLNTLALDAKEFDELMSEHIRWAKNPVEYLKNTENLFANVNDEDGTDRSESIEDHSTEHDGEIWRYALNSNPIFAHEYKIQNILKMLSNGLRQDCARGKIIVRGEIRYLSRDLLGFLIDLIKENADTSIIQSLKRQCMFEDEFFMPGTKLNLEITRHYPIFRNPHLSRNEQCVLKPYIKGRKKAKKDLYYRYLSHLSGVIMVPYQSLVPQALGGADFDGDIVKIIDDARVRNAVLRGTYNSYRRKLPIIEIPSAGGTKLDAVSNKVSFDVIKDTFSNKIGQISNLSIRLGNREYGRGEKLEHPCAECTILTGLEIDAAKTGEHPDLAEIMKYGREIRDDFDYVSDFKEKIDELSKSGYRISKKQIEGERGSYSIKKHSYDSEPLMNYEVKESYRNLDKIPMYYMDMVTSGIELPGNEKKVGGKYIYFDFLEDNSWKKQIDQDLQKKIGAIIASYYHIEKISSKLFRYRQFVSKGNFEGYVRTILQMQYDYEDYAEKVDDELAKIWAYVDSSFETKEQVESALEELENSKWAFLLPGEKKETLAGIINYDNEDDIAELIWNFDAQGYNLLFYILKDVWVLRANEMTDQEALEGELIEEDDWADNSKVDYELYTQFYSELYKKYTIWREDKDINWKKRVFDMCDMEVKKLLSNIDSDARLQMLYSLRGTKSPDKNSLFFWNNVTLDSIKKHMT